MENEGSGAFVFDEGNSALRSLLSSNATIAITQNADHIDLQAAGGVVSPYQEIGDDITPVTASVNAIVSGSLNTIHAGSVDTLIGGCTGCGFTAVGTDRSVLLGSSACTVTRGNNVGVLCSANGCDIGSGGGNLGQCAIIGCNSCTNPGQGSQKCIIASESCVFNRCKTSLIAASTNCSVLSATGKELPNDFIIGSVNSSINQNNSGSSDESHNGILASLGCTFGQRAGEGNTMMSCLNSSYGSDDFCDYNSMIATESSVVEVSTQRNLILGGSGHHIHGFGTVTVADDNVILGGSNGEIRRYNGCVLMTSGTTFAANAHDQFTVKKAGGSRVYSNDAGNIGVALAPGGNTWASVSDANLKENFVTLDGAEMLEKLDEIPVFRYNFKGNPSEQCNMGPTAQDWHEQFACDDVLVPLIDEDGFHVLDDDGPMFVDEPAKDTLRIEMMDVVGVLMAAVKTLNARVKVLERDRKRNRK